MNKNFTEYDFVLLLKLSLNHPMTIRHLFKIGSKSGLVHCF